MTERHPPIAVVGVSTLFPGSLDATGFWKDILAGTDRITDVPASHWLVEDYFDPDPTAPDKTYARRGAFVPEVDFDPMAWGVPPSTVPATDTCQLLALIVAQRVLEDASRGQFSYEDRERMSVVLGVTSAQELLGQMNSRLQRPVWTKALREMGMPESEVQEACERIEAHYTPWQEATFPGVLGNVVAGRIANRLNLGGTNCVTDAACASTFSALSMAVNELATRQSDVVICGGADAMNDIFMFLCFSKTPALSKSGDCRPFSDQADGTMLGEGFGMVALKRLDEAERDGDRIYAVIRGVGSSSDGKGAAVYAPVPKGQAKAIRRAYEAAGYGPDSVELVEAHGTGTIAGHAAEFEGLRTVFEETGREDRQWCAIGSVKSQIGHAKAAAGAAGLIKAIFALQHRVLPPTIKVDAPNPKLALDESPFHLGTRARPWVRGDAHPRRAGVSSFGFGGSNFHIALEEYTGDAAPALRRRAVETELFVFGAATPAALAAELRAVVEQVAEQATAEGMFAFLARDSQERYAAQAGPAQCRLALVAEDGADLAAKLQDAAARVEAGEPFRTPNGTVFGVGERDGEVGFVFPGQGSQYVDMGASVAMTWDEARAPWDAAASLDVFAEPLHQVVFPKTAFDAETRDAQSAKLTATEWAQPAIGATSLSHLALLDALGVTPSAVAGHSFGEIIALHAAGVLSREDALRVARRRGELMAEAASTPGAMTAVSASAEVVRAKLAEWNDGVVLANQVVLANDNGPTQVVLSGPTEAIEATEAKLSEAKLRFRRLPVATAFHSSVVSSSVGPFREVLGGVTIASPDRPVFGNTEAAPYPRDAEAIRDLLANQLASPVRFVESIEAMYAAGVRTFVEVGPGSVLCGLVGRILEGRPHLTVPLDDKRKDGVTSLHQALARLVGAGIPLDLAALWRAFEPVEDPRESKKPKLTLKISGTSYGKPYPPEEGAAALPGPNPKRPT
ncbi:MAG: beta-ketoacyl synthase N-terminal-like domain-containing protein, partial [Sandaracinaceae bacterium]